MRRAAEGASTQDLEKQSAELGKQIDTRRAALDAKRDELARREEYFNANHSETFLPQTELPY